MIFSFHISNEFPCRIAKNGLIDSCIAIRSARLQCRSLIPECALVHMAYVACSSALSVAVNTDLCKGQSCTAYGCSRPAIDCGLRACAERHSLAPTSAELKLHPQTHVRYEIALKRSPLPGLRARNIMHANACKHMQTSLAAVLAVHINEGNQQRCSIVYSQRRC